MKSWHKNEYLNNNNITKLPKVTVNKKNNTQGTWFIIVKYCIKT